MSFLLVRALRPIAVLLLIALTLAFALPAAAQDELRAPPANDHSSFATSASMPFSEVVGTISEATIQPDETQPCIGGTGERSVWYRVVVPQGGTLEVDTTGSNYDTVISVWRVLQNIGPVGFANLDCEDDGTAAALLRYPVTTAGEYLISVSEVPSVPVRAPQSLVISLTYKVPAALRPAGSDPDHAVTAKLNKTTTLSGIEYAMAHDSVVAAPVCSPHYQYAAWFKFTVPFDATIDISTQGSLVQDLTTATNTVSLEVFAEGFDDTSDSLDCDVTTGSGSAQISVSAQQGTTYYLRVMKANTNVNIAFPSRYKITVTLRSATDILVNPGFENIDPLLGWKVKNGTGETTGVCPGSITAFVFTGGPGENSQLQQNLILSPPLAVDDRFTITLTFNATGDAGALPFTAILKLTYSDGTIKTFKQKGLTSQPGGTVSPVLQVLLSKGTLSKIRAAVQFKGTTSTMCVDDFGLVVNGFALRDAEAASALPLPLPPAQ